jgi:hypothetical protein
MPDGITKRHPSKTIYSPKQEGDNDCFSRRIFQNFKELWYGQQANDEGHYQPGKKCLY